ncbi:phage tail family protein (plasmid) [Staphylococcus aureus]|nr:phage tail family protein [Staphylococcus aureus]UXV48980.1 phage tail family protein [Staphylococcus aureus]
MIYRDLEIINDSGTYKLSDNPITLKKLKVKSYNIGDLDRQINFENKDLLSGRIITNVSETFRKAKLIIEYDVEKIAHVIHLRTLLNQLFSGVFYLRELVPTEVKIPFQTFGEPDYVIPLDYADGMQIPLVLTNISDYDTNLTTGEIEVNFESTDMPYFESIGTSLDLEKNMTSSLWSSNMNIPLDKNNKRKYTFENVNSGEIYYYGNAIHDHYNMYSTVTIVIGEPTKNFKWNLSNSELMKIEGIQLTEGDVIKYDGVQTYKNDNPINEYTSLARPVYTPGKNEFTINQKVKSIKFDMKFYYK